MSGAPPVNVEKQQQIADYLYQLVGSLLEAQANLWAWFQSIPMTQKFIVVFVFVAIIFSLIYGWYMRSKILAAMAFDSAPAFITDLKRLPNTKLPYEYEFANGSTVPYLPSALFQSQNAQQFTWTFWLYVNGFDPRGKSQNDWGTYRYGEYKHVMSHGSSDISKGRESLQSPGFWLKPTENTLVANVSTAQGLVEIDLPDFPLNRWTHIALVLDQGNVSLYRNGGLIVSRLLPAEALAVKGQNVYLFNDGGFAGSFYNLQYTNSILTPSQIALLHASGKKTLDDFMRGEEYKRIVEGRDFKQTENVSVDPSTTGASSGSSSNQREKEVKGWF